MEARGGIEEGQFSNMPGNAPDKEGMWAGCLEQDRESTPLVHYFLSFQFPPKRVAGSSLIWKLPKSKLVHSLVFYRSTGLRHHMHIYAHVT